MKEIHPELVRLHFKIWEAFNTTCEKSTVEEWNNLTKNELVSKILKEGKGHFNPKMVVEKIDILLSDI